MTTFTEGPRAGGFIISEANGSLSRDNGTVKAGEVLSAGEIVAFDGDELVAWTDGEAAGVMLYRVNASAQATPAAYLARQAEVNAELLVYPDDVEEADALAALASLGIVGHVANIGAGGGGGGYEGPLDIVTAVIGYSQRALSAAMLGQPVIEINSQAFSPDAVTGAAPDAEIAAFLDGAPGHMTRWNNQGSFGSVWDFTQITGTGFEWVADLLNGHSGMRSATPYADNTTYIDGLTTQHLSLPMTVFAIVSQNINSGLETRATDQSVFSSLDCSYDTWVNGYSTEAGISLATPVTGVHLHVISVGASGQEYRIDGVLQEDLSYSYGHGSETIPVTGAWIINNDAGAVVVEIFYCSGAADADITAAEANVADYYGITLP